MQQRASAHQTGIAAVWLGREEVVSKLSTVEAQCHHTTRSAKGYSLPAPDETRILHDRSVARGIHGIDVAAGVSPSVPLCSCCSLNVVKTVQMRCMLVDESLAIIYSRTLEGDLCAVAATDRRVVSNAQAYLTALTEVSLPLTAQGRERSLTPSRRQLRVMSLMARGLTDDKIAEALRVTSRTVRTDVAALYTMFDVRSRFELGLAFNTWLTRA